MYLAKKQVCYCHPTPLSHNKHDVIGVFEVVLDRRLSMDDNRGLGHGVMDNKVTLSSFRLLVEHRSSADSNVSTVSYFIGTESGAPSYSLVNTAHCYTLALYNFVFTNLSRHV